MTRGTDTDVTKSGLGNSLLGVKWRFHEDKKRELQVSMYPQLEFNNPTSSVNRGLVERGVRFLVPLEVAKKFGPVDVNGEVGYWIKSGHITVTRPKPGSKEAFSKWLSDMGLSMRRRWPF